MPLPKSGPRPGWGVVKTYDYDVVGKEDWDHCRLTDDSERLRTSDLGIIGWDTNQPKDRGPTNLVLEV